jgi:hypothetical protein
MITASLSLLSLFANTCFVLARQKCGSRSNSHTLCVWRAMGFCQYPLFFLTLFSFVFLFFRSRIVRGTSPIQRHRGRARRIDEPTKVSLHKSMFSLHTNPLGLPYGLVWCLYMRVELEYASSSCRRNAIIIRGKKVCGWGAVKKLNLRQGR